VAVERIAHLGSQCVTGTKSCELAARGADRVDQRVEDNGSLVPRRQQFVAVLAGVAGAAHPH
jgi:hypothetical protein